MLLLNKPSIIYIYRVAVKQGKTTLTHYRVAIKLL